MYILIYRIETNEGTRERGTRERGTREPNRSNRNHNRNQQEPQQEPTGTKTPKKRQRKFEKDTPPIEKNIVFDFGPPTSNRYIAQTVLSLNNKNNYLCWELLKIL